MANVGRQSSRPVLIIDHSDGESAPDTSSEKSVAAKSKLSPEDVRKDARAKDSQEESGIKLGTTGIDSPPSPKKGRKVNHACAYCRRLERPCGRCIARNIGHLCHDELREPIKRTRNEQDRSAVDEKSSSSKELVNIQYMPRSVDVPDAAGQQILPNGTIGILPSSIQPRNVPSGRGLDVNSQWLIAYNDWLGGPNQSQDMHWLHWSSMFNASEATNEYNMLGDCLSSSLLHERVLLQNQDVRGMYSDPSMINPLGTRGIVPHSLPHTHLPPLAQSQTPQGDSIQPPAFTAGNNQAHETYYMTTADPSGSDSPEERMNKLLKAKYDAGLLKPFNYVKGYARLNEYMENNTQHVSRQKILRQLDKFRPRFQELMHSLTDIELIVVDMWFEQSLMEYDRVFASMAIPACCWRRTGEIFRGNNEMAQLIDVPIENLRDGKLAIHEIITEDHLVSYWEKFGAIAFDNSQKAVLTSCSLKHPTHSTGEIIPCCFSFTIRRDIHNIPSLIVGNFLPMPQIHQ